jgi:lysophospholipid acyltransferase (LPLAT)-like uncharacterized protein
VATEDQPKYTFAQRLVLAVAPRLVWALLSLWGRTWRYEVIAEEGVTPVLYGQVPGAEIYCFWHQCVLPAFYYFRCSRTVVLISPSYDGELITRTTGIFGYGAVRGSSSRGSRDALPGLKRALESGRSAIFAADGPRGPIHQSKMGPIKLAQMTGAPIRFFHLHPEHAWIMRSWDGFIVPKPFTRMVVSWAKDMHVPADLAADHFESMREKLNASIERARMRAEAHFKKAAE